MPDQRRHRHLVARALLNDGRVATFDRGVRDLVPRPHDPAAVVRLIS